MDAAATQAWFNPAKANLLVIAVIVLGAIVWSIQRARGGATIKIRRIAGLDALDEAVGRATEMGRSVLYVCGMRDLDNVQTIAGVTILGAIARKTAEYDTRLLAPTCRSLVMSTARETVRASYLAAGRPDLYSDEMIYYVTDEQFGYVAHLDGLMVRQKPATCIYMGPFFAESLILAETGNSIGAIQVAGTAQPQQLPFFVAACDYVLIGEELFAASAYLSRDPGMVGSLKGQDFGKLLAMVAIGIGALLETARALTGSGAIASISSAFSRLFALNF
jgi:hypothetical protein